MDREMITTILGVILFGMGSTILIDYLKEVVICLLKVFSGYWAF